MRRELAVNTVLDGTQKTAAVAANARGDFVVTWHSDATGGWEIAARRYALLPAPGRVRAEQTSTTRLPAR